jgi:hypothetical protein
MITKVNLFLAPMFFFIFHCATWLRISSWILTTVVPFIFLSTQYSENTIIGLLTFYCVLCIYDIGYIYNDVVTFRKEDKNFATDRLKNKRIEWESRVRQIIVVRSFKVIAILFILIYLGASMIIIITLCMLALIYHIYNSVRGFSNLIIYPFLNLLKYIPYLLALTESFNLSLVYAAALYTAPTFLCWLGKVKFKKFNWQRIFGYFDEVRLLYFISLSLMLYFLSLDKTLLLITLYMLSLRTIFYLAHRNSNIGAILGRVRVK